MLRKTVSGIMLTLLLTSLLSLALNIQPVKAGPKTWYVDDSGGADFTRIQDAIYAASVGDTIYVYNGTYHEYIYISKSLSLIGENKYATVIEISGYGSAVGISYTQGVKFTGFTIRNAETGINLLYSSNNVISGNIISNSTDRPGWGGGIYLWNSNNNIVVHNSISNTTEVGVLVYGFNNTVTGNFISGATWAIHVDRYHNSILSNVISESVVGVYIQIGSHDNTVIGNTISDLTSDGCGVQVWGYDNEVIDNAMANIGYVGIQLDSPTESPNQCTNNSVKRNRVSNCTFGINLIMASFSNTISGNNLTNNGLSILIADGSNNNTITKNHVSNGDYGILLFSSNGTEVYHNNFINNTQQVLLSESFNTVWDDGYPSGGNYWSDYTDVDLYSGPYQNETGNDGIWDHPYVIDESNRDHYPFTPSDITIVSVVPSSTEVYVGQIVNITVTVQNEGNSPKTFDVTCKYELEGIEHTIGTQTVTNLAPNTTTTLIFTWTTTDITVHTIKAEIPPLTGETDTADNTLTSPTTVKVKMIGDVNGDNKVNIRDIVKAGFAFSSYPSHPRWNPQADINQDGKINIQDIVLIGINFGKTYP